MIDPQLDRIIQDLHKQGGGTYWRDTYQRLAVENGYAVARRGGVHIRWLHAQPNVLDRWLTCVGREWEESFVGTWLDGAGDDAMVYIDAVRYIRPFKDALAFAREEGQRAIYDFGKKKVLRVNYA